MTVPATAADLLAAIALAEKAFRAAQENPAEYQVVQAQRLIAGGPHCTGTRCWRLTFKRTRLIPATLPAMIGSGGELSFTVDLDAFLATLTGHGD